jgi:hypothetical protein
MHVNVKKKIPGDRRGNRNTFQNTYIDLYSPHTFGSTYVKHLDSLLRVIIILYNIKYIVKCLLAVSNKKDLEISQVHSDDAVFFLFVTNTYRIKSRISCNNGQTSKHIFKLMIYLVLVSNRKNNN